MVDKAPDVSIVVFVRYIKKCRMARRPGYRVLPDATPNEKAVSRRPPIYVYAPSFDP